MAIRPRRDPRVRRGRRCDRDGPEAQVTLSRRALRFGLAASLATVIIAAVVVVPARTAFAHAELLSSDPPAGAQLEVAPAAVTLQFNESVTFVADSIRLIDATGATRRRGRRADPSRRRRDRVRHAAGARRRRLRGGVEHRVGRRPPCQRSVHVRRRHRLGARRIGRGGGLGRRRQRFGRRGAQGAARPRLYRSDARRSGLWAFVLLVDRQAAADRVLQRARRWWRRTGRRLVAGTHPGPGGLHGPRLAHDRRPGHRNRVDRTRRRRRSARAGAIDWARVARSAQGVVLAALAVGAGVAVAYGGHGAVGRAHWLGLAATGGPRRRRVGVGRRARRPRPALVVGPGGATLGRGGAVLDHRHGRRGRGRRLRRRAVDPSTRHVVGGDRHRLRQDVDREGRLVVVLCSSLAIGSRRSVSSQQRTTGSNGRRRGGGHGVDPRGDRVPRRRVTGRGRRVRAEPGAVELRPGGGTVEVEQGDRVAVVARVTRHVPARTRSTSRSSTGSTAGSCPTS